MKTHLIRVFSMLVLVLLWANLVLAQTTSTAQLPQQPSLSRWKDNTRISYFGELLGSNLEKWDDNQYDQNGQKMAAPTNLYNQFNVAYRFLPSTMLLMSPRFYVSLGDRNDLSNKEDQHNVYLDDWLFGILQEYVRTKDLIFRGRLTHRHPFNTASQNANIDSQIEYQNDLFWMMAPGHTLLVWNTYRYYSYESQVNENRYRINLNSIYTYDITDKWKFQVFHELDLQHRAPKRGTRDLNKQKWNYFEKNKNHVALGVGYSPIPNWSFIPFIKALNDENWSAETTQMGVWVLGRIL